METYDTETKIGTYITVNRSVGHNIQVTCENGSFSGSVRGVPDSTMIEEGTTTEIKVWSDEMEDDEFYVVAAQVLRNKEMRSDYDLYAVHYSGDSETELGEITQVEVEK